MEGIRTFTEAFRLLATPAMEKELEWAPPENEQCSEDSSMDIERVCQLTQECQEWMGPKEMVGLVLRIVWHGHALNENGITSPGQWRASIIHEQPIPTGPGSRTRDRLLVLDSCIPWSRLAIGQYEATYRSMESAIDLDRSKVITTYKFRSDQTWHIVGYPTFARTFGLVAPRATLRLAAPKKNLQKVEKLVRGFMDKRQKTDYNKSQTVLSWLLERLDPEVEQLRLNMDKERSPKLIAEGVEFHVDRNEAMGWSPVLEAALGPGQDWKERSGEYFVSARWETLRDLLVLCKYGAILEAGFAISEDDCGIQYGVDYIALFKLAHLWQISGPLLTRLEISLIELLLNATARRDPKDFLEVAKLGMDYDLELLKAAAFLVLKEKISVWEGLQDVVWGLGG